MKKFSGFFALLLLFLSSLSSLASASEPSFTIVAGDVLHISVWKEEALDREVLVLPDGSLNFPLVGTLQAAGKTPLSLQDEIKDKLVRYIPDASVSVTVKEASGHTVSVLGQVAKPGAFLMGHELSVMEALSQAGGLTPYADEGSIRVLREKDGKKETLDFPYDDIAKGENLDKDIRLLPGDVVIVPTAGLF